MIVNAIKKIGTNASTNNAIAKNIDIINVTILEAKRELKYLDFPVVSCWMKKELKKETNINPIKITKNGFITGIESLTG